MLTKYLFNSFKLCNIATRGCSTVNIDIINILRFKACLLQCKSHGLYCTMTFRMRSCNMMRIGCHTGTYNLCVDFRTRGNSMLIFLENKDTGTLAHYKTVTIFVERTACL